MKLVPILSGLAIALALAGCAQTHQQNPTPAPQAPDMATPVSGPNVSGNVLIRQKVALPPDAVLTVTLSDASLADAPSKVLSQKVARTEGKQAPFSFVLPYNPADIQPNARIVLSAAVTLDGKLLFITDTIQEVINHGGTKADVTMVPVPQTSVPVSDAAPVQVP